MVAAEPQVLMEISAIVHPSRQDDVVAGYRALLMRPAPEGLLETELLQADAQWRILMRWRSRAALDAAGGSLRVAAASRMFRAVHADPVVSVLEVRDPTGA